MWKNTGISFRSSVRLSSGTLQTLINAMAMLSEMKTFEELVVRCREPLCMYALKILGNREDAEDAVQDAFIRAYRAWDKFNQSPSDDARLRGWIYKITLNVIRNRFRRKRLARVCIDQINTVQPSDSALENHTSPEAILDQHATFGLIEDAIERLPAHLHESARLRFIDDLTHPEIADRCSQPLGTVKSHIFRARLLLCKTLESSLKKSA